MQFHATGSSAARQRTACAIVGIHESAEMTGPARELDRASGGAIRRVLRRGDFSGKSGEALPIMGGLKGPAERVLLVGLGTKKGYGRKTYRRAIFVATNWLAKSGAANAMPVPAGGAGSRVSMPTTPRDSRRKRLLDPLPHTRPQVRQEAAATEARPASASAFDPPTLPARDAASATAAASPPAWH